MAHDTSKSIRLLNLAVEHLREAIHIEMNADDPFGLAEVLERPFEELRHIQHKIAEGEL